VLASGLSARWAAQSRFVVLETGFGNGERFLETWAQWRADPQRCKRLYFLANTAHPPSQTALAQALVHHPRPRLARRLVAAWPHATPDVHLLAFEGGQVHLMLAFGATPNVLRQWVAQVNVFYLSELGAQAGPPDRWAQQLTPLSRLAATDARVVAWNAPQGLAQALRPLGFEAAPCPSSTLFLARFEPKHIATTPPGRQASMARSVAVIGAGLAGAAAARALAEQGLQVTAVERFQPASAASGNAQGLYHPLVHGADSLHARWFRACAALAHAQHVTEAQPQATGLLRMEFELPHGAMQALLTAQKLPETFARALNSEQASHVAGLPLKHPAWWLAQAGALPPRAKVLRDLATPGVTLLEAEVSQLVFEEAAQQWCLLGENGKPVAIADAVVLANGQDAQALCAATAWPQTLWRGQTSTLPKAASFGLPLPKVPISGLGYATAQGTALFFGATNQRDDADPAVRIEDHQENLARYAQLCGEPAAYWQALAPECVGRTGWRVAVAGRLPVLGPLPAAPMNTGGRRDSPRLLARTKGLYVLSALASRGLTQAPLAARILAAWITGAPQPVAASLVDAVDVARFSLGTHGTARIQR
jgi:tRNA 5-methylaminomethyl-2-thiouridine biosynthesis bifunctional protein